MHECMYIAVNLKCCRVCLHIRDVSARGHGLGEVAVGPAPLCRSFNSARDCRKGAHHHIRHSEWHAGHVYQYKLGG